MKLHATFQTDEELHATFRTDEELHAAFGEITEISDAVPIAVYDGPTHVTPALTAQTLPTADRHVLQDISVGRIPTFEVGNAAGGKTYIIGG